jgi:hypothetical protein
VVLTIVQANKVIGTTVADRYRRDLEPNGVGDGRHAFEFIPPEGLQLSPGEVAVHVEGTTIALVRNDQGAPALLVDDLMRRIVGAENAVRLLTDRLIGLRRQVQATDANGNAVVGSVGTLIERVEEVAGSLARQREHLEQLEVFALRFDEQMAELKAKQEAAEAARPAARWPLVLTCFVAAALGAASVQALVLLVH